jgi:hypothetical protein
MSGNKGTIIDSEIAQLGGKGELIVDNFKLENIKHE